MNIIVTGATGLVGGHIVKKYLDLGYSVIAMGRNQKKLNILENIGASILNFDITSDYADFSILNQYTNSTWIHCAAAISGADENTLEKVNVQGTKKLIKKAEELEVRFIHISSITVYGISSTNYKEDDPLDPASKYAISKIKAEDIVKSSNLSWTILRPPFIGGPNDEHFLYEFHKRISSHKMPMLSKKGEIAYIDARDIANVTYFIIDDKSSFSQIYNIAGQNMKFDEFVYLFGDLSNVEKPYVKNYPYIAIYMVAFLLDIIAKITGKTNTGSLSRYRIKSLSSKRIMDTSKIYNQFSFVPQYNIEQSLSDWINSTKKQNQL